jgi:DNA-binding MarR family transcriptional regulator
LEDEPMSDDFTSHIFAWLRQVFADETLHPTAFKLAFAVSQYVNRKKRKAWPSLPTLAGAAGISKSTAIRLIDGLEANGHIEVERHRVRGRNRSNIYRLNVKKGEADDTFSDDEMVSSTTPFQDEKGVIQSRKRCHPEHEKVSPMTPEPTLEPSLDGSKKGGRDNTSQRRAADAAPPGEVEEVFAVFWGQYPKRQAKDAAWREFQNAVTAGADPKDILAGAMRYSADCTGKDAQYIARPDNWLRGGRWKDEPASARPEGKGGNGGNGAHRSRRNKPTLAEVAARRAFAGEM